MGRGIAALGAGVGDYFKQQGEDKKENKMMEGVANSLQKAYMGTPIGDIAGEAYNYLKDENTSFRDKTAAAASLKQIIPMMIQKQKDDVDDGFRRMQLAQGNRGLAIEEGDATSRANMLRDAKTDAESERKGRTKALEWGLGAGDLPSMSAGDAGGPGALLPPKGEMGRMAEAMKGMDGVEKLAFLEEATKRAPNDNFATKTFKETRVDPETGESATFDVERVTVNGLPTETIVASAPRGKPFPSVEEEVDKSEKMARSKAIQTEIDEINTASREATKALPKVAKVIGALASGDIRTGAGAEGLASLKRLGQALGIETNVATFEEAATVLGDEVMARIGQTKGSVSEKEMELFQNYSASPSKTTEGNLLILRAKAKSMLRSQAESRVISELQNAGASNAQIKVSIEEYRNQNPVITEQELNSIRVGDGGDPVQPGAGVPSADAMRAHIDRTRGR